MKTIGEIDSAGRAICLYLAGSTAPSPTGKLGMPSVRSGGTYIDMMAEIGGALNAIDKIEHRLTGRRVEVNTLVKRWSNYLLMVQHRNALKTARKRARTALKLAQVSGDISELQEWEEAILRESEAYDFHKKENNKLRKSSLYVNLMGVFRDEVSRRGVRV